MSPKQIRLGRAILGWSQARLADECALHPKTIAYWEGKRVSDADSPALQTIRQTFARHGVTIEGNTLTLPIEQ